MESAFLPHVGIKWAVFQPSLSTLRIAFSCSSTLAIRFCVEPHRVAQSVIRQCRGSPSSSWICLISRFFFQLWENVETGFLQPCARSTLLSFLVEFWTARWRLWPKQVRWVQPRQLSVAHTMFDPLSVVRNTKHLSPMTQVSLSGLQQYCHRYGMVFRKVEGLQTSTLKLPVLPHKMYCIAQVCMAQ